MIFKFNKNKNKKTKNMKNQVTSNTHKIKSLLRNTEIFNPTLRTFSNFESGLKFQKLLYKSKFLVPLISNQKHLGGKMLYINNEYKTKFYLIFTDFEEINNCFKKGKYQYFETTLDKVSKIALKNNAHILLNWKSDNYILNQETLQTLFNKENLKTVPNITKHNLYTDASNKFPHFKSLLLTYLQSVENINKVYFLESLEIPDKYILALDIDKSYTQEIIQEIRKIFRKEKLDFTLNITTRFKPYSKYPCLYQKDLTVNNTELHA